MENDFFLLEQSILNAAQNQHFERVLLLAQNMQKEFPQHPFGFKAQGFALVELNRKKEAIPAMLRAVELDEKDAESLSNLGQTLTDCARNTEEILKARLYLEKALQIEPSSAVILNNLAANLLAENNPKNFTRAHHYALKSLSLQPQNALALLNAGIASFELEQKKEAQTYLREALTINPHLALAHNNLGLIAHKEGKIIESLRHHSLAFELEPHHPKLGLNLAQSLHNAGQTDTAIALLKELTGIAPEADILQMRMMMDPYSAFSTVESVGEIARKLKGKTQETPRSFSYSPQKRFTIGFLSGDFRQHACSFFLYPLLSEKEEDVDFIALDTAQAKMQDATTDVFLPLFTHYESVRHLNNEELAQRIQELAVDVLVDVSGYTEGNRLSLFALRPAPVSVTWLGWLGGLGIAGMDYILSNEILVPGEHAAQQFSETPLMMPDTWVAYHPASNLPEVSPLPALKNKKVTFGAFHNVNKVQLPTLKLWASVLTQMKEARLIWCRRQLKEKELVEQYKKTLRELGVLPHQVIFFANSNSAEYAQTLQKVDFVLDTFPVSGGTVTNEALYMGVPSLTLTGELMGSRLSASVLTHCGLEDWVCHTKEEYTQKALFFARECLNNPQEFNAFRQQLRGQFLKSKVCNARQFAHHFIQTLRRAYETKQRSF